MNEEIIRIMLDFYSRVVTRKLIRNDTKETIYSDERKELASETRVIKNIVTRVKNVSTWTERGGKADSKASNSRHPDRYCVERNVAKPVPSVTRHLTSVTRGRLKRDGTKNPNYSIKGSLRSYASVERKTSQEVACVPITINASRRPPINRSFVEEKKKKKREGFLIRQRENEIFPTVRRHFCRFTFDCPICVARCNGISVCSRVSVFPRIFPLYIFLDDDRDINVLVATDSNRYKRRMSRRARIVVC